jgi:molybdate transport system substrate-binding protein
VTSAHNASHRLAGNFAGLLLATIVGACSGAQPSATPPAATTATTAAPSAPAASLTIYAASSLKAALTQAKTTYEAAHPGTTLTISSDSSSALETKIEQGAPVDVFLSADTTNPKKLVDGGFAAGAAEDFATNVLTLIVPKGNPAGITSAFDLAKSGVKVIAAGDTVPITKYATMLVKNLAAAPGAPAGFEAAYAANVVTKAENVAAVVAQIELGQGDVAIVYVTDAKTSTKVDTVVIAPASANVVATYAGVVVKASYQQAAAQAFLDWLAGPDGQALLASFGFGASPA